MTEHSTPKFNLLDEPWITVRHVDGSIADVSLRTVFAEADRIREIGGEVPTQTFAIIRLLLAILYSATVTDHQEDAWSTDDWTGYWHGGLPLDSIYDYLDEYADRFWLLHPERPFFQVADLATAKGEIKNTSPLILDLPSNNRLFTNRSGDAAMRLPLAEAARWLINAQAFDPSGIKSGAVGDRRVTGGKGYPIGLAWSGLLGGILLEGESLRETLLLNFVVPEEVTSFTADPVADIPPWEEETPDTAAAREGLLPRGPARLFTWQSRRIRLVADGDEIVGCVLANGDALTPQNQFSYEPMSAWRYSEPQTKRAGVPTYMPREHQQERAFWRGISALLPQRTTDRARPPASLDALGARRLEGSVPLETRIDVRAIGVVYGSNNSVVDDIIDDRLTISLALLRATGAELAAEAESAVALADDGVRALRRLAENLTRAAGGSPDDAAAQRGRADTTAYAMLDGRYRAWLSSLDKSTAPAAAIAAWKSTAYREIRALGAELVRDASPAAWIGREVRTLSGTEIVTTPRAEAWFLRALHKTFGASAGAVASDMSEIPDEETPE